MIDLSSFFYLLCLLMFYSFSLLNSLLLFFIFVYLLFLFILPLLLFLLVLEFSVTAKNSRSKVCHSKTFLPTYVHATKKELLHLRTLPLCRDDYQVFRSCLVKLSL